MLRIFLVAIGLACISLGVAERVQIQQLKREVPRCEQANNAPEYQDIQMQMIARQKGWYWFCVPQAIWFLAGSLMLIFAFLLIIMT